MNTYSLFPNHQYSDLFELAKDIYKYPGRFYKAFQGNELLGYIQENDNEKYIKILELKKKNYIPDVFLFKASYILNPYMELRYHKWHFKSYSDIGKTIKKNAPKIDVYILDLLRFGLLEEYMLRMEDNLKKPALYTRFKEVSNEYSKNHNLAYFKLGYALDSDKAFYYDGIKYEDPKEFLSSQLLISSLFDFAGKFEKDCAFLAWLEVLGHSTLVNRFKSVVSLIEEKEKESIDNEVISHQNKNSDLLALFYKGLEQ